MNGTFIAIEGPGGVGKSTLTAELVKFLAGQGRTVHLTQEPSSSQIGVFTRAIADSVGGRALACLVAADRYHHVETEITPHLRAGEIVVCDRYVASSLVLQRLDGVPSDFIRDVNAGVPLPDAAVFLTASLSTIRERIERRGAHHRFERDPELLPKEVRLYREAAVHLEARGVNVRVVDVDMATPSKAASEIVSAIFPEVGTVADHD